MVAAILSIPTQAIWALIIFIIGSVAYAIKDLISQGKLKFASDPTGFWGEHSYLRKYKNPYVDAPNNWYYKRFKINYKEAFPGSATCLVFLTDGFHLMQFVMLKCMAIAPAVLLGVWWLFIPIRITWWIVFNVTYTTFSR